MCNDQHFWSSEAIRIAFAVATGATISGVVFLSRKFFAMGQMNLEFGRSNAPQPKAKKWLTGGSRTTVLLQLRSSLHY
jgi:hypothetical protein